MERECIKEISLRESNLFATQTPPKCESYQIHELLKIRTESLTL